jgi:hypothetical protein
MRRRPPEKSLKAHAGRTAPGRSRSGPDDATEPPAPPLADWIIASVAARFGPWQAVDLCDVCAATGVTWEQAKRARDWGLRVGAWPWLLPASGRRIGGAR